MSVDRLQEKIRKCKNPSVFHIEALPQWLPAQYGEGEFISDFRQYVLTLLGALKDTVPAVRFGYGSFALVGAKGLAVLEDLMAAAREQGYYVLLDLPECLTVSAAKLAAQLVSGFGCDGFVVSGYLGSDVLQSMLALCKLGRTVFVVCRTANRSAVEVQDLLTGGRLVHGALADVISRHAEGYVAKGGYSQMGILGAASSATSLTTLRNKFPKLFLLLDGYDYPNSNAKNCSGAFDRLGHGAAACASDSIGAAWKEGEGEDPAQQALQAALRMKKNLTRYVTVL